ncbi:MAG: carbohydrate kinase [Lachnospiraceae bacterium]|nr:carbohydrate kinase [Lachnospiraceae bacterium]
MEKSMDVTALGELLIDFVQNGVSEAGNPVMEAAPGGAPCNVLAMLNNLGHSCAFIGKVGRDSFGDLLEDTLKQLEIDTRGLVRDGEVHTTLAFVHTAPDGDRSFSFYRNPGADMRLSEAEVDEDLIARSRIFHFGSLSLTDEPCRSATVKAVAAAKRAGCLISFDPNLRESLWPDLGTAREQIAWGLSQCEILKISENELAFVTGTGDIDRGAEILQKNCPNIRLLNVTAGSAGSFSYYQGRKVSRPVVRTDRVVDTTGAGDTFCGCVLHFVLQHGLEGLSDADLGEMLRFANAAASVIIGRKGALKVMPSVSEIPADV